MKNQAIRLEASWPTGHHTLSRVRSELLASGRNSRNRAPSTGRLPPTPDPTAATSRHSAGHDGA